MIDGGTAEDMAAAVRSGDKRAAAVLMSMVERAAPEAEACLRALRAQGGEPCGRSHVVGVTGWPGVGKSTLVGRMARRLLSEGRRVGIVAVDPTSPVSGGSILGDRERMRGIDGHERLFIRSMATRGHTGGIGAATDAFVRIMEAMGKDTVIVETVGVGQDQVSVANVADTVVVTVIPGMGDYLQALKAGIMELGDIFVVNKADRKGVEKVVTDLRTITGMTQWKDGWVPPIVKTVATAGEGVGELLADIARHRGHCAAAGLVQSRRLAAVRTDIVEALKARFLSIVEERTGLSHRLEALARQVLEGRMDRYALVDAIFRETGIVK